MAKLAMRYRNEGVPDGEQVVDQGSRRVRFGNANGAAIGGSEQEEAN